MIVGLTAMLVPLALALLLPCLRAARDADVVESWRYPRRMCKFFLYAVPFLCAMMAFVYSTFRPGHPRGVELAVFLPIAIGFPAMALLAYVYFDSYRVRLDDLAVIVGTTFGTKRVELQPLAEIWLVEGRGNRDLTLRDASSRAMIHFDGSLTAFDELLFELERRTRSPDVRIFKSGPSAGWMEKENLPNSVWRPSQGPDAARKTARRTLVILIAGAILIAAGVAATHVIS